VTGQWERRASSARGNQTRTASKAKNPWNRIVGRGGKMGLHVGEKKAVAGTKKKKKSRLEGKKAEGPKSAKKKGGTGTYLCCGQKWKTGSLGF